MVVTQLRRQDTAGKATSAVRANQFKRDKRKPGTDNNTNIVRKKKKEHENTPVRDSKKAKTKI